MRRILRGRRVPGGSRCDFKEGRHSKKILIVRPRGTDGHDSCPIKSAMDRIQRKILLLFVCLIMGIVFYCLARHDKVAKKASKELATGVKVLSNPESLVED